MSHLRNFMEERKASKNIYLWIGLAPLIVSLTMTVVILTVLRSLPTKLPLFYSVAWGDAQLATHQQFLIIPAIISAVALLNIIISWQLHHQQSFFKKMLFAQSVLITLILTITFIKIILIFI